LEGTSNLHNSSWRQGSVLSRELLEPGTLPRDVSPECRLIVISHDCDLVHHSYENEPFVEFFLASPAEKSDGRKRGGKNPRRFQFVAKHKDQEQIYEISVHDKFRVGRKLLEKGAPDLTFRISKSDVNAIARWAGKRYCRPAFATEFDRRLSAVGKEKFERALQKFGTDVSGIFISFLSESGELPARDEYSIIVTIVAPRDAVVDDDREQDLLKLVAEFRRLFGNCPGIRIEDFRLKSEAEFSLEDWKSSQPWDYEFISEGDPDHAYVVGPGAVEPSR